MALNNDPNFPPSGPAPYFINREWCIGDSLTILNNNANNFDTRIENLNTLIGTLTAALNVAIAEAVPAGAVQSFVQTSPPEGWISCEGVIVPNGPGTIATSFGNVTGNFANLYNVVGNKFGVLGQLPDLRGYFVRGHGTNSDNTASTGNLGRKQGDVFKSHNHSASTNFTGAHTHRLQGTSFNNNWSTGSGSRIITNNTQTNSPASGNNIESGGGHSHTVTVNAEGDATETRPKNISLLYCIKY